MNCSVCNRPHHAKTLPFLCAVDARNRLYELRIDVTKAQVENEELERQVDDAVKAQDSRTHLEDLRDKEEAAVDRTNQIIAQADRLRIEVEAARKEIEAKKDVLARRRSDLASVSAGGSSRRIKQLEEAERAVQRTKYKWGRSYDTMAATRTFLCEEAARLYGLRQVKKGSVKRYEIGGVEIFDVFAMNNLSPEVISTVLAHLAHILVLASHYLMIRLPAEITLPHRDYPRPTIFQIGTSYRHGEVPFPGSEPTQPVVSVAGESVKRPRPLYIDKALPELAKDDPQAYSYFIEGVTLLAYDIAWVCASQAVSFGDRESCEDVLNMGHNLWRLLIGDQLHRRSVEPTFPSSLTTPAGSPRDRDLVDNGGVAKPKSMIGRWSHGTTHTSLNEKAGQDFIRGFKIMPAVKLSDQLKNRLSSEAPMLEWEKIDGDEFDDGLDGAGSMLNVRRPEGGNGTTSTKATGTSGWTRVKTR
ncbi:UV radiation resistance protein and autophagy-related subunit 14-domain-containing protein [Podospora australis]|uniref:Autophagy-related protein 14 n=1 Tax=Podospora australis TaxID=1536484 RepID=A0AAN7AM45_9PEZI|nr:UV radiation resistance protein and autophagy-related subunit 14-domain-containing protein [Podospora australis]